MINLPAVYQRCERRRLSAIVVLCTGALLISILGGIAIDTGTGGRIYFTDPLPASDFVSFLSNAAQLCLPELLCCLAVTLAASTGAAYAVFPGVLFYRGACLGAAVSFCTGNAVNAFAAVSVAAYAVVTVLMYIFSIAADRVFFHDGCFSRFVFYLILSGACAVIRLLPYILI